MRPTETIALRREPGHLIRSLVALLLRLGLGMVLLMAGLDKLDDLTRAADAPPPADPALAPPEEDEVAVGADDQGAAANDDDGDPPYPESIRGMFADTWLARDMKPALDLYTAVLPFAEAAVGALLIVGLFTTLTAFASGLLLLSLTFGLLVLGNTDMSPNMMIYLLVSAGILWLSPITSNYLSLDGLLFGWFWKPRDEGEYRREYEAPVR